MLLRVCNNVGTMPPPYFLCRETAPLLSLIPVPMLKGNVVSSSSVRVHYSLTFYLHSLLTMSVTKLGSEFCSILTLDRWFHKGTLFDLKSTQCYVLHSIAS